jgi:hypothetical protein
METYLDGTGYNTYGNQYPEVEYWILRGDTKHWILVSQLDTEKKYKFQTQPLAATLWLMSDHGARAVTMEGLVLG